MPYMAVIVCVEVKYVDLLADGDVWLCFFVLRQRLQQVDYDQILIIIGWIGW